jgi:hypothetical protein
MNVICERSRCTLEDFLRHITRTVWAVQEAQEKLLEALSEKISVERKDFFALKNGNHMYITTCLDTSFLILNFIEMLFTGLYGF